MSIDILFVMERNIIESVMLDNINVIIISSLEHEVGRRSVGLVQGDQTPDDIGQGSVVAISVSEVFEMSVQGVGVEVTSLFITVFHGGLVAGRKHTHSQGEEIILLPVKRGLLLALSIDMFPELRRHVQFLIVHHIVDLTFGQRRGIGQSIQQFKLINLLPTVHPIGSNQLRPDVPMRQFLVMQKVQSIQRVRGRTAQFVFGQSVVDLLSLGRFVSQIRSGVLIEHLHIVMGGTQLFLGLRAPAEHLVEVLVLHGHPLPGDVDVLAELGLISAGLLLAHDLGVGAVVLVDGDVSETLVVAFGDELEVLLALPFHILGDILFL